MEERRRGTEVQCLFDACSSIDVRDTLLLSLFFFALSNPLVGGLVRSIGGALLSSYEIP